MNQQKNLIIKSARGLAYQILFQFERSKKRLDIIELEFGEKSILNARDRRLLKNLVSGSIRHLLYLDWIISELYKGKFSKLLNNTKTILRLALYEIIFLDHIPVHATLNEYVNIAKRKTNLNQSKLVNGILRNYLRTEDGLTPDSMIKEKDRLLSIKYSVPVWLVKRWITLWGVKDTEALCNSINHSPEFDIQVNTNKISNEQAENLLTGHGISFRKSAYFTSTYTVTDLQPFLEKGWLNEGIFSIQDESAQIPVDLLDVKQNDTVLDMCAAPGGKFLKILKHGNLKIKAVALDIDKSRLKKVKQNMDRLDCNKGFLVVADGNHLPFKPVFSKVLLDAPCSGLGVISKHPEIKYRRTMNDIREFSRLQSELLLHASEVLMSKGRLVYSTCTIDPLENENVVNSFLEKNANQFTQLKPPKKFKNLIKNMNIHTFPHVNQMDGSYCALLKKK